MKQVFRPFAFLFLGTILTLSSCEKDPEVTVDPVDTNPGKLSVHFDSRRSATEDFVENKMYLNANNDSVSLKTFKYFISNVTLIREDGSSFAEPNSYHLIQAANTAATEEFTIANIPAGNYSKIKFSVGVDAARNSSTAQQVGDLSVDHDMTWDWNTGYMFVIANGKYYEAGSSNPYPSYLYTIGKDANFRTIELPFPTATPTVQINQSSNPEMHIHANIFDIFGTQTGANKVDVKAIPIIGGDPQFNAVSQKIADNYAQMFRIDHIHTH